MIGEFISQNSREREVLFASSSKPFKGDLSHWKLITEGNTLRVMGIFMPCTGEASANVIITSPVERMMEGVVETANSLYGLT